MIDTNLQVIASEIPNNKVIVNPGYYWTSNNIYTTFPGGTSASITPSTGTNTAKYVVVALNSQNKIELINGDVYSTQAVMPVIPVNYLPLAHIFVRNTFTIVTSSMIVDMRPVFKNNVDGVTSHVALTGLNTNNSHPISAITNLQSTLDSKMGLTSLTDFTDSLNNGLQPITGTTSANFTLNNGYVGVPNGDCSFIIDRGSLGNVYIKWSENDNKWVYTDSTGNEYGLNELNAAAANATTLGLVQLSTAAADPYIPIAVGINDTIITDRVISVAGKTGTVVLAKADVDLGNVDNTSDANKPVSTATQTALDDKVSTTAYSTEAAFGITQLSVAAADPAIPIAVGDNDTRLTAINQNTQTALDGKVSNTDATGQIFLTDTVTSDIYRIEMISGTLTATLVV
jgi:hypothetical protein